MAGQSISAHTDAATVAQLRQTARREGRTQSQLTAASLKLYLGMPDAVRTALRDVEALGTPEDQLNMMRAIARAVVSAQYEVSRRKVAESMQLENEAELSTDDAILAEAVRAVAKAR
jgi:hypothetical protein